MGIRRPATILVEYHQGRRGEWRVELRRIDQGGVRNATVVLGLYDEEHEAAFHAIDASRLHECELWKDGRRVPAVTR